MAKLESGASVDQAMPTLNQLAITLGIPAVRLQSAQVAYKPIEGEPYVAKRINWDSVRAFIERRLDKTGHESVDAVLAEALTVEHTPKRSSRGTPKANLVGTTPVRKGDVGVGSKIENKKTKELFEVIYVDSTIVVFRPFNIAEGEIALTQSIGNRMFNMNYDDVTTPIAD